MAFSTTIGGRVRVEKLRIIWGTFTSANGDNSLSLTTTTHGLNQILWADVSLHEAALDTPAPKLTYSNGSLTAAWEDTQGASGRFVLIGLA